MDPQPLRVFVTDCEGPITKNDNAAELAESFIPSGSMFFARISLYDDYLAEIARKPGYKAGDTLRLILPFFKAFGVDNQSMSKFSRLNIEMIPLADRVLRDVVAAAPAYIVSTSYSPYVKAVCDAIGFPYQSAYCTQVNIDDYTLTPGEKSELKRIHSAILQLPDFSIPSEARSPEDLPGKDRDVIAALDDVFWSQLPEMDIYRITEEVNPVGGTEKARAIEEIAAREETEIRNILYVGDSITDVEAFRLVRKGGGMTVSFNGNDWAVREAAFAVTAENALPIGLVAHLFLNRGADGFQELAMTEIRPENMQSFSAHSSRVRKSVRTEKIGALG